MNTKFKLFSFSVLLMLTTSASLKAQLTPWYLSGNNVSAAADYLGANNASMFPVRFRHYVPSNLGRFEWYTDAGGQQERMRLTNAGWLGINTIPAPFNGNPAMMLR